MRGGILQRLYSTFADRWQGVGLLLQRLVAAALLVRCAVIHFGGSPSSIFAISHDAIPHMVGGGAAIFFLIGLGTPFVGVLIALIEVWIAAAGLGDVWLSVLLATIGLSSAMLGPGAFSVDACLFGRRHLQV